jgi:hypothetical protein
MERTEFFEPMQRKESSEPMDSRDVPMDPS